MDPILLAYNVESSLYDIGPKLYPISIRDQMIRGYTVVERATAAGIIGPRRPLLVVGAGAAGVVAALVAIRNKVPTSLAESTGLFSRQFNCDTRHVCPTQYDWPLEHWTRGQYPWTEPKMPLKWQAERASVIIPKWINTLRAVASDNRSLFEPLYGKTFIKYEPFPDEPTIGAYFDPPLAGEPKRFSMVLSCVGPGEERCRLGSYSSYPFWDIDPFEKENVGLAAGVKPRVFISGGGDGALQDFLRIVTTDEIKYAKDIYNLLPREAKAEVEGTIQSAEDHAQRAYTWAASARHDCAIQRTLNEKHQEAINRLAGRHSLWREIGRKLNGVIKEIPRQLNIRLAYPCDHFSNCYGLNRFLVLLIAKYMAEHSDESRRWSPLHPLTKTVRVKGLDHTCQEKSVLCHGKDHDIAFVTANCDNFATADERVTESIRDEEGPYNVVILRHGIIDARFLFGKAPTYNPRQMLPYHVIPERIQGT